MPKGVYLHKGHPNSKETRNKISVGNRGKKRQTEAGRRKLSERSKTQIGSKNPFYGKTHTDEFKERIRKRMRGNVPWNKGKVNVYSEETREKIRQARLRQVFPFKDTFIEVKLQNFLKENNIPFETHYPILGQPDIFIKPNVCIFADGCYWHACPVCGYEKLIERREKDLQVTKKLQSQGYIVIRLWEHEINNLNL